jgi:hypothetical protein
MTPPQAITLVAVSMAAITAIIGVVQQLHIQSLQSQVKDANKRALNSLRDHANEREVSAKLEADLKIADKDFDALAKESKQIALKRDEWHNKYLDVCQSLERQRESLESDIQASKVIISAMKAIEFQYTDLIAMPRRKRDKVIAELRAK